jgi:hypothetical protein
MHVDVPLVCHQLLRLFRGQRGLSFNRIGDRCALLSKSNHRRTVPALRGRTVDMDHHGRTRESIISEAPRYQPPPRVVGQVGCSDAGGVRLNIRRQ